MAFVLLMFSLGAARAQVAGMSALSVLDMPASAQAAGMGFDFLSLYGADLPVALGNPSLIGEGLNNKLCRMPEKARLKIGETVEKIINDGCNGLICIIL